MLCVWGMDLVCNGGLSLGWFVQSVPHGTLYASQQMPGPGSGVHGVALECMTNPQAQSSRVCALHDSRGVCLFCRHGLCGFCWLD